MQSQLFFYINSVYVINNHYLCPNFKTKNMKELVANLNQLFADFSQDAELQVEKGNKAAGTRARKTSLAIEKALKEFRKVSIEAAR
jgi:hypothetical protein